MPQPSSPDPVVSVDVPLLNGAGLGVGVLRILMGIIGACPGNVFEMLKNRPPCLVEGRVDFDDS